MTQFVGRESELARLRDAADAALAGQRQVVLISGEAGIGKTRLIRELETHIAGDGAVLCWGRSREAAGAPPYWPWIQAGRALGERVDSEVREAILRPDAKVLQRIFPEIGDFLDDLPAAPEDVDAVAARFELFESVTRMFKRAAARRPLVLVIEDLHWADQASHLLFAHLAAGLGASSVLLIGTYRDGELSRNESLPMLVAELNREPGFESIPLPGLHRDEVIRYFDAVGGPGAAARLGVDMGELAAGNPFFVEQLASLVASEGPVEPSAGTRVPLPDGIRAVLMRRLAALSDEGRNLLSLAAVVGYEFTYAVLAAVEGGDADEHVLALLEEATAARIIEEMPVSGRFRFVHALMHETLLAGVSVTRRARMHGRIGEALEDRWAGRLDEFASRLAAHFVESAAVDPDHAARALRYSELAGRQAESETAWDVAVGHYDHALALLADEGGQAAVEAEILIRLGRCHRDADRLADAWRSLIRATDLFRSLEDPRGQARATLELTRVLGPPGRAIALVLEALEGLPPDEPQLEARLHADLLRATRGSQDDPAATLAHRARASELAEAHGFLDVQAAIVHGDLVAAEFAAEYADAVRLGIEAHRLFRAGGLPATALDSLLRAAGNALLDGHLDRADELARKGIREGRSIHAQNWLGDLADLRTSVTIARGDGERLRSILAEEPRSPIARTLLTRQHARLALGDLEGAQAALEGPEELPSERVMRTGIHATRARILYLAGEHASAAREFELMNVNALEPTPSGHSYGLGELREVSGWAYWSQALTMLDDAFIALAPKTIQRLWFDSRPTLPPFDAIGSPLLLYARVGIALGEHDRAREILEGLLAIASRERAPLVTAGCHLALADIAEANDEKSAETAHLQSAVTTLEGQREFHLYSVATQRRDATAGGATGETWLPALTNREAEVLRLVAAGHSSREIAESLVLSVRTVERHIANIYRKTDTHSRAQATAFAFQHGLASPDGSA